MNSNAANAVFTWSNGVTGNTITAAAGAYTVTITDNVCSRIDTVRIPDTNQNIIYGVLIKDAVREWGTSNSIASSITDTITISGHQGAIIGNNNPLAAVWANMEHSLCGDLNIKLTCPNNTSVMLKNTGVGYMLLGHACTNRLSPNTRGTGYTFVFSANGTTTLNNATNTVPYTDCTGGLYSSLEGGTFLPENPLSGFNGCPLDGNWTITISDALYIDNGYLFDWGLQLANSCSSTSNFGSILTSSDSTATYTWSNGQTTPTLQNVAAGTYTATITNPSGCFSTATMQISNSGTWFDCIYPGDANNNGVANNFDLLPIALSNAMTSYSRLNASTQWTPQSCQDWADSIPNTTINRKYTDCDGNGTTQAADILVILQNYGQTHQRAPFSLIVLNNVPIISCVFPTTTVQPASYPYTLQTSVNVGSAVATAIDITGLAFTINYDPAVASRPNFNLSSVSWLGAPNELYHLVHDDGQGHLDVAVSRFDRTTRNGYGEIATVNLVIEDNVIGKGTTNISYPFVVNVSGIRAINNQNIEKTVNGAQTQVMIENMVLATSNANDLAEKISVSPNPTTGFVRISTLGLSCSQLHITNMLGQEVAAQTITATDFNLQLAHLPIGIYTLNFTTPQGIVSKRIVLQ